MRKTMTITLTREEAQRIEQYTKPGALIPVDMQTTQLLVNALRARLSAPKEWQSLTDEERTYLAWESNNGPHCVAMTEAKLKEKNSAT
jgi:hypothetical protein